MTLSEFVEIVRRRHNAESDTYWSDDEIYQILTNRINRALSVVPLLEGTDTSNTSTAATQAVAYPSDCTTIRQVNYKATRLQRISFRKWELYKNSTTTISGLPEMWVPWNREVLLVPIPDTTGDAITIYYYKYHAMIDGSTQTTIDIPAALHDHLVPGVLADMFTKDLNTNLATYYEAQWQNDSMRAFYRFKSNEDQDGRGQIIGDGDTDLHSDIGAI